MKIKLENRTADATTRYRRGNSCRQTSLVCTLPYLMSAFLEDIVMTVQSVIESEYSMRGMTMLCCAIMLEWVYLDSEQESSYLKR